MDDELRLEAGKLVLFRRNGLWQARIAIGNRKYLWKSLKTSNTAEAKRLGLKLFHQTEYKLGEGLPVQSRTFDDVIDEYIAEREADNKLGKEAKRGSSIKHTSDAMLRQIKRVSKFWKEYAGKRAIEAIDDKVLRDFIPWRKTYYHKHKDIHHNAKRDPTDKTLQFDLGICKMVLRYAKDHGYLGNKPLPTFAFTPKLKRVRPAFTPTEFRKLRNELRRWIDAASDNAKWVRSRWLLHDYALTLAMSGIRVGEANNLRIRDVDPVLDVDGRQTIQLYVRGKTGTRTVQPHIDLYEVLKERLDVNDDAKPNDWLFAMPDGSKIITLADQFDAFLKFAGLRENGAGEKYTLYSLRHYYAVKSLARADILSIAQNMGTSVAMIESYYGKHGISPERARKLAGSVGDAERLEAEIYYPRKSKSPKASATGKR